MFSHFQNNKSYPVISRSYYTIKYFNEFFTGGRELGSHFITKIIEGVKRLFGYTENLKSPLSSSDLNWRSVGSSAAANLGVNDRLFKKHGR